MLNITMLLLKGTRMKGNIVGIDASKVHLENVQKLIKKTGLKKRFLDLVWFSDVLETWRDIIDPCSPILRWHLIA